MRLATVRLAADGQGPARTSAVRQDGDSYVEVEGHDDVGSLLASPDWYEIAARAAGRSHAADSARLAPVVPHPAKVFCVGLNYASHISEMGRDLPEHPTLFAKFADTLTGPYDDVELPDADPAVDWEAELVIVIGTRARRVSEADSGQHIAGFTVANDISMRSYQFRTKEWLQGKAWEASTPLGPVMVTRDAFARDATITTDVDGAEMQRGSTSDLVHGPEHLVSYISQITTLHPGDLILTGTTGGVGRARTPEVYLQHGQTVTVSIDGIGALRNRTFAQGRPLPALSQAASSARA